MALELSKITPCLWFDRRGEEAALFYVGIFPDSQILEVLRYPVGCYDPAREGEVMTVTFKLNDQTYVALNGGPQFKFSEAISLQVLCDDQEEVDRFWVALREGGGSEGPCGWLKDRFGLSWQVVPRRLLALLTDSDARKVGRVNAALMKMGRIDVAALERAARS